MALSNLMNRVLMFFVHISAVQAAGMSGLNEGQQISYELEEGKNGNHPLST